MNRNKRIARWIRICEEKWGTDHFQYGGHSIWPILRLHVLPGAAYSDFRFKSIKSKTSLLRVFRSLATAVSAWASKWTKASVIHVCDISFYRTRDGQAVHKFAGPVAVGLDTRDQLFIDVSSGPKKLLHPFTYCNIQLALYGFQVMALLYVLVTRPFLKKPPWWNEYKRFVSDQFDIKADFHVFQRSYQQIRILSSYFSKVLSECRPAFCTITSYYSIQGIAFVHACRTLKIPIVDIQHGLQGSTHFAFMDLDEGRNSLPYYPSHFWKWQPEVEKPGPSYVYGGHPWLYYIGQNRELFVSDTTAFYERINRDAGSILVTLQTFEDYTVYHPLFDFIGRHLNDYNWIIRAHPVMLRTSAVDAVVEKLNSYGIPTTHLTTDTTTPLIFVLEEATLHITAYSSVVLEAYQLDVPNIVLTEDAREIFEGIPLHVCTSKSALDEAVPRFMENRDVVKAPLLLTSSFKDGIAQLKVLLVRHQPKSQD